MMVIGTGIIGKTITEAQITGERGVAIVKDRAHGMGFLFNIYGAVEAGIDAIMELRDRATGQVGGRFVAVQVKTRKDRPYTAETDTAFEYLCDANDVAYWQRCSVPVIVVLVRLSDQSVYWKVAPRSGNPILADTRRLTLDKTADRFDAGAANAIMHLTVDQAQPGIWLPASREPEELFLNAVKVHLPRNIFVAPTPYRNGKEALKALLEFEDHPPGEWVLRGGRLVSFLDVSHSLLRHIVDQGSIEPLPVSTLSSHDDEDERRIFVELLNRTFRAQFDPLLAWNRTLRLYYFPADKTRIDRTIRYPSLKNETERAVVKARRRADGSISYVRHSAFRGQFWPEFGEWFFTIEPTYLFTRDGFKPDRFAGERVSKLKRLENNAAIRGQFLMWRSLLVASGSPSPQAALPLDGGKSETRLQFSALESIQVPASLPDNLWRARDVNAPDDDDGELPL